MVNAFMNFDNVYNFELTKEKGEKERRRKEGETSQSRRNKAE